MLVLHQPGNDRLRRPWGIDASGKAGWYSDLFRYPESDPVAVAVRIAAIELPVSRFSDYTGYTRLHHVLNGETSLLVDGRESEPIIVGEKPLYQFSGAAATVCSLRAGSESAFALSAIFKSGIVVEMTLGRELQPQPIDTGYELIVDILYRPNSLTCKANELVQVVIQSSTHQMREDDALIIQRTGHEPPPEISVSPTTGILHHTRIRIPL